MSESLTRRAVAELLGTLFLVAAIVGSGIMGDRLSGGSDGLALLANTLATGAALVALILAFGPISGGHFNPVVTVADATQRGLAWGDVPAYLGGQFIGGVLGTVMAHAMFGEPLMTAGLEGRTGTAQWFSEFVATFGLLAIIWGASRRGAATVPFAVAAYITAAYWFTASTSFANPAVTVARAFTDSFSGIRPGDVPGFILAQAAGGTMATLVFRWLVPPLPATAARAVVPREGV